LRTCSERCARITQSAAASPSRGGRIGWTLLGLVLLLLVGLLPVLAWIVGGLVTLAGLGAAVGTLRGRPAVTAPHTTA